MILELALQNGGRKAGSPLELGVQSLVLLASHHHEKSDGEKNSGANRERHWTVVLESTRSFSTGLVQLLHRGGH